MIKPLLAGLSAGFLMAGVVAAQTYPPPTTPPEIPGSGTSTTTIISPGPNDSYHATTTQHSIDMYGNRVTRKDIYREGIAGSSETHTTTTTDPWGGSTTTRATTTNHQ